MPYLAYIRKLIGFFDDISFHQIPREENQMVNTLATLASMFQLSPHRDLLYIEFRCHGRPAHCCVIEEEKDGKPTHCCVIEEEKDDKPWYFDIKRYIEDKEYPLEASNNDKRMLQRFAPSFFLSGNILYKRNHDMVLLRCVDAREAEQILVEVHEGSFETHANGHAMARKILRMGYYWLTM